MYFFSGYLDHLLISGQETFSIPHFKKLFFLSPHNPVCIFHHRRFFHYPRYIPLLSTTLYRIKNGYKLLIDNKVVKVVKVVGKILVQALCCLF